MNKKSIEKTTQILVQVFASSKSDFCNPLFNNLPKYDVKNLCKISRPLNYMLHKYDYFWAHYIQDSISNLQGSTPSVSLLHSRFGNSLLTALNFLVIFYKTSYSC